MPIHGSGAAERVAMTIGAESGAVTGPIPAEARHQKELSLERPWQANVSPHLQAIDTYLLQALCGLRRLPKELVPVVVGWPLASIDWNTR